MSITKKNLLDLIESHGREMKALTSPYSHPYDDEKRAKSYEPKLQASREAWTRINRGDDPAVVLAWLGEKTTFGIEANHVRLLSSALKGAFEATEEWLQKLPKGFYWVTYKGDFFGVSSGDELNRPRVDRIANGHLPND